MPPHGAAHVGRPEVRAVKLCAKATRDRIEGVFLPMVHGACNGRPATGEFKHVAKKVDTSGLREQRDAGRHGISRWVYQQQNGDGAQSAHHAKQAAAAATRGEQSQSSCHPRPACPAAADSGGGFGPGGGAKHACGGTPRSFARIFDDFAPHALRFNELGALHGSRSPPPPHAARTAPLRAFQRSFIRAGQCTAFAPRHPHAYACCLRTAAPLRGPPRCGRGLYR